MKTNKILGILMAVLMVASAVALVSAKTIPEDCIVILADNKIPEEVNVTSYYGDGTVKESFLIPAHDEFGAADGVQMLVPKNGKISVSRVNGSIADSLPAYRENGKQNYAAPIHYMDDDSISASGDAGRKIGFRRL
ncbi:MAG: hypothetical protein CfClM3_1752 [Methanobrevibacter sp. CfCl-M3]